MQNRAFITFTVFLMQLLGLLTAVKIESLDEFDIVMENRPGFTGKECKKWRDMDF